MDPTTILLFLLKFSVPMVVKTVGKTVYNKLLPPIKRATEAAVKSTAEDLGSKFPSVNFLEYNFRFDSSTARSELEKLISDRKLPDENLLKKEMSKEIAEKWPAYSGSAEEIVEVFLKHFEKECLAIPELQTHTLASIIKRGDTATQQAIFENGELTREEIRGIRKDIEFIKASITPRASTQEEEITKVTSALEKRLLRDRDDLIDSLKKWQSKDLYGKVEALAKEVRELGIKISQEIAGSIFRVCGSYNLRSFRDKEAANYWINLATNVDPLNHKTIALQGELLCFENKWADAYEILTPIAYGSTEPFVKIIYSECVSHLSGVEAAFEWLMSQDTVKEDNEVKLNIASLAIKGKKYDYALKILDDLVARPFPGPYPHLFRAEIFVKQAMPQETVVISAPEDQELRKRDELIMLAIDNLKKGITFLEIAARPLEIPPHVQVLSELYIAAGDLKSAEKTLCTHWKSLRKGNTSWFIASTISFLRGDKEKALVRAQKALTLSKKDDYESMIRFGLASMNAEAWDKCLQVINSIPLEKIDDGHRKGVLQMKALCYHHKGLTDLVNENIEALRSQFTGDETWVILQALILKLSGKPAQAVDLLSNELNNYSDSVKIKLRLAAHYKDEQKYDRAFPLYKDLAGALTHAKPYEEACKVGLYAEMAQEVISMAIEAENKGIASDPIMHFKAIALAMNKQYDEALDLFSKFYEASLTRNDYVFYALCLTHKARSADAVSLLEKGKNKFPQETRIVHGLFTLYLELNSLGNALTEAKLWLKLDPDDKGAYFAAIQTGFAAGEQEFAHNTLMEYLTRFGEGPELRSGTLQDVKKHLRMASERSELLWREYEKGLLPEVVLSNQSNLGIGGHRITLLRSSTKVMAFNGNPDSQKRQYIDTQMSNTLLLDYYALITIYLLDLFDPVISSFQHLKVPEIVLTKIKADLTGLPLSYQRDVREIQERTFAKVESTFQIYSKIPEVNPNEIPEALGNSIYDVLTCNQTNSAYVTPAFEAQEVQIVKDKFKVDIISLLDLIDLMKEKGIISVKRHEQVWETVSKYRLRRLSTIESVPNRAIFDWKALEILEECNLLDDLSRLIVTRGVGPFTYGLLRSEIERYQRIDDIQNITRNIEEKIKELVERGICRVIATPRGLDNAKSKLPKYVRGIDYFENLKNTCLCNDSVFWTDDLGLSHLMASNNIKTTCTRAVLDVLSDRGIITQEELANRVLSLVKWRMHFCWLNANVIINCCQMYDCSKSDDVMAVFGALTNEIQRFPNQVPDQIEMSNFNVAAETIQRLWPISEKAQLLSMALFDEIFAIVETKEVLRRVWIVRSILSIALIGEGEVPLSDFLRKLSLRITGQIHDELRLSLRMLIELCLKEGSTELIPASAKKIVAARVIKAIREAIPSYTNEIRRLALEIDPVLKALI